MIYYPDYAYVTELMTIHRERSLPPMAEGQVRISQGQAVGVHDIIAEGTMPSEHIILDAMSFLGLKKPEQLEEMLFVKQGDWVTEETPLAGKNPEKGKRLFAPQSGIVRGIQDGRIVIQKMPEVVNLESGAKGQVVQVREGRGVVVETTGAYIQGSWGNNRSAIAILQPEPKGGLENLVDDGLNLEYKGMIAWVRTPVTEKMIRVAETQNMSGIIAPSIQPWLREFALESSIAILLMEGFGNIRMSNEIVSTLSNFEGQQATVDAYMPSRENANRPGIIINQLTRDKLAPMNPMTPLKNGMRVRINRAPWIGQIGKVIALPNTPVLLDNGLRARIAQVEMPNGVTVQIPLPNLEIAGR